MQATKPDLLTPATALAKVADLAPSSLTAPEQTTADSAVELLRIAVENKTPVEQLKELVALHGQMEQRQARREFFAALRAFQQDCPPIKRNSEAKIATGGGSNYQYTFADFEDITTVVDPILAKHGLSYGFDTTLNKEQLEVVCLLRHDAGHEQATRFSVPTETKAGMSPQQKVGAALTFAKRYALSAALGLTTTDAETDPRDLDPRLITDDQATQIEDLLTESKANRAKFLEFMGAGSIAEIRAVDYQRAVRSLEQKKAKAAQ